MRLFEEPSLSCGTRGFDPRVVTLGSYGSRSTMFTMTNFNLLLANLMLVLIISSIYYLIRTKDFKTPAKDALDKLVSKDKKFGNILKASKDKRLHVFMQGISIGVFVLLIICSMNK